MFFIDFLMLAVDALLLVFAMLEQYRNDVVYIRVLDFLLKLWILEIDVVELLKYDVLFLKNDQLGNSLSLEETSLGLFEKSIEIELEVMVNKVRSKNIDIINL